jgi:anti-sigma factor RsiW
MRCSKVAKALPLYVGHDLKEGRSREISAHLERCGPCRAIEAGLRESRAWLEAGPRPPLDETDYSAVRRGVWQRIESQEEGAGKRRLPGAGRLVLAGGLLAAALLAALLSVRQRPEAFPPAVQRPAVSPVTAPAVEPVVTADGSPEPAPDETISSARPARVRPAARAEQQSVVKIEFQTANPGVRIIWLVKKGGGVPSAAASRHQEVS